MGIRRRSMSVNYSLSFYWVTTSISATWKRWIFSVQINIPRNRLYVVEISNGFISTSSRFSVGLPLHLGHYEFQHRNETINYSEHTQWLTKSESNLHQSSSAMCGEYWRERNGRCLHHRDSAFIDLRVGQRAADSGESPRLSLLL